MDGGNREIKLINSGTYGCVYRPEYTCKGQLGSDKYITKIQKDERSVLQEFNISKKIRNISGYVRHFSPVLKYCKVKIKRDVIPDIKKCDVFKNESEVSINSSDYYSMKIRYLGKEDLRKYMFSVMNVKIISNKIFKTYLHCLKSVQKLHSNGIVHFDLKYNNIMFDKRQHNPLFIDFGQSWTMDDLRSENELSNIFFVFDEYDYWCIDIVICSYIFKVIGQENSKTVLVTEQELDYVFNVFVYGLEPKMDNGRTRIANDVFLYGMLNNPKKMYQFKDEFLKFAFPFLNKPWWELYSNLINYTNTWDCYSLAVIYLNMLDDLLINKSNLYYELISSVKKVSPLIDLLEDCLYSAPNKRPSIEQAMKQIEIILHSRK